MKNAFPYRYDLYRKRKKTVIKQLTQSSDLAILYYYFQNE